MESFLTVIKTIAPYKLMLLKGARITTLAWICASIGSLLLGSLVGVAMSRASNNRFIRSCAVSYSFIAKGVPVYVQILIAYFVLPSIAGINLSGFIAATGALIFCSSGYTAHIICGGINAIPNGQWDASFVLGYSNYATLRRIVAPQVASLTAPMLLGECEQLLKSTSLLATIGVTELTRAGMNIISRELNPLAIYLLIAILYLGFAAIINLLITALKPRVRYANR
jgi:polar amino acid transport system permease protein